MLEIADNKIADADELKTRLIDEWAQFESRVAPLFHWVATLGKLFTHIASPVSQLQETGVQKGVFGRRLSGYGD